jgi:hypothetical protein
MPVRVFIDWFLSLATAKSVVAFTMGVPETRRHQAKIAEKPGGRSTVDPRLRFSSTVFACSGVETWSRCSA